MTTLPAARPVLSLRKGLLCTTAIIGVAMAASPAFAQTALEYRDGGSATNRDWNTSDSSFTLLGVGGNTAFTDGDSVTFQNNADTVTIDGLVTPGSVGGSAAITFNVDGYLIQDDTSDGADALVAAPTGLTIDAVSVVHTAEISAPITGTGGVTTNTTGNGTIILSGTNTTTGTLTVNGGVSGRGVTDLQGSYVGAATVATEGELLVTNGTITGLVTMSDGALRADGGTFNGGIQANATTGTVGNAVQFTGNSAVNGIGLNNNGAFVSVDTGVVVTSPIITNSAGRLRNDGTLTGIVSISGAAGSIVEGRAGMIDGTITLTGGTFNGNGGTVTGLITNNGGSVNLNGVTAVGGVLNQLGTTFVTEDVTTSVTNADGFVSINAGATLTTLAPGFANNSGNTNNRGTISGNVTLGTGIFTNSGNVNGTMTLTSGTLRADAAVAGTTTVNAGVISGRVTNNGATIEGNGGAFNAGIQNNSGIININAATTAATVAPSMFGIDNVAGAVNILEGGTLTGDIGQTGAGTITNTGTLTGGITMSAGILNADTDSMMTPSTISGEVNVSGGTVNLNGGSFNGGLILSGLTTVNLNDATIGNVTNNGVAALSLTGANGLTGNFTQAAGITTSDIVHTGNLIVSGGTFNHNGGSVSGSADVSGMGILNLNTGTIGTGQIGLTGGTVNVVASASATVDNNGGLVNVNSGQILTGNVTMSGGEVDVIGNITGTVGLTGGILDANAGMVSGLVMNGVGGMGGTIELDGTAFMGGIVNNLGGIVNVNAPTSSEIENTGGQVTVLAAGSIDNALGGYVYSNTLGTTNNNGAITGDVAIVAGTLENDGNIGGTVTLTGGRLDADAGTITGLVTNTTGTVDMDGSVFAGGIQNNSGTVNLNADTTTNVTNAGGLFVTDAGRTLTGTLDNDSGITRNNGIITGNVTMGAGSITNTGTISGTTMMSAGNLVAASGTLTGTVTNTGGRIFADGATFTGGIVNTAGRVTVRGNTIAPNISTSDGLLINPGVTLTGSVTHLNGNTTNNGTVTGAVTIANGALRNNGNLGSTVGLTGGTLNAAAGTITGRATNDGGIINADGSVFTAGIQNNSGTVNINQDTSTSVTNNGGTVIVDPNKTLMGTFINTLGMTDNNGTIAGNVTIGGGTVENDGDITGTVGLTGGRLNADRGTITGLVTNNGGTVDADGSVFTAGITNTTGTVNVNENTTSNITNGGGDVFVDAGKTLTGNITNTTGDTDISGRVTGTVVVNGGTVDQIAGADTQGLTTVNGGTLNAQGGAFSGGIETLSGALNITANTTADIDNKGATISIPGGRVLTGSLTNTSGTATVDGQVSTLTVTTGSVTTSSTAIVTGATALNGGTLTAAGGAFNGGIAAAAGSLDVTGATTGDLAASGIADVDIAATGTVGGNITQSGGTVDNAGTVSGTTTVTAGAFTNTGTATGAVNVTGGSFDLAGGALTAGLTNAGGTVDVTGAATADLTNTSGTMDFAAGGDLTGNVTNAGTLNGNGGALSGTLTNTGTVAVNSFGLTAAAANLQSGSTTTIVSGTLTAPVTAQTGSTLALNTGVVTGNVASAGLTSTDGASSVTGNYSLTGNGQLNVDTGAFMITGTFDTEAATVTTLDDGTTLSAVTTNNAGTIRASAGTNIGGGVINNAGTIDGTFGASSAPMLDTAGTDPSLLDAARRAAGDRLTFNDLVNNTGTINITDTTDFAGGLNNTGTVDLTFNPATTDVATIGGAGLSGAGTFIINTDLTGSVGTSDTIVLGSGAVVTGNVNLQFDVFGAGGRQEDDLVLIDLDDGDPGNFTVTASGLPDPSGVLLYTLARDANGDVVVVDGLNPGIGALAGNIVLTQSLIGSVINRPSSPFVSGLAYEDENPCGVGAWARTTGGFADSSGRITEVGSSSRSFDGQIEASYSGFQLGGDYACFNGFYNGWDVALGGIAGINLGNSTQPVFALDLSDPTGLSGALTSTTTVDFTQTYAGAYVTAVNGPVALDLQYRVEQTDFSATNVGANGLPGLGLNNAEFSSSASTISGAVSYAYPLPETELTFVPTLGFAYTQVATDSIEFENRGVVDIDDFTSQTVFAGGTLSRTKFGDDGVSAVNQFLTATIYSDFADDPTSSFTPVDDSGLRSLASENLSTYSELSAGVNYVRILQPGELGSVKQVSASVRGDVRFSDQLESWGLTGQVRFQF